MPLNGINAVLSEVLERALDRETFDTLAVAVSGGSDSLALLHLAAEQARRSGLTVRAVTVDHGLRPEAAAEARSVAECCQRLGVAHETLKWQGWDGTGNLQDQARRARYRLMAEWAKTNGIDAIAVAHTLDDQAETFLMRLAREAGVDGLSAMMDRRLAHGVVWLRPFLHIERQQLRDYLTAKRIRWLDDPSNADSRFDRIKARQVMKTLAPLGIDPHGLAAVANSLRDARGALEYQTQKAAESVVTIDVGDVVFDRAGFAAQPVEIGRRLLVHAIKWVSSAEYGPRGRTLAEAHAALLLGTGSTLHGCRLLAMKSSFRVTRELNSVKHLITAPGAVWDKRWQLSGPENNELSVRALGEAGLRHCADWRETDSPRASLLATPAVWCGDELVAAPLAGRAAGWTASLIHPPDHFTETIISH